MLLVLALIARTFIWGSNAMVVLNMNKIHDIISDENNIYNKLYYYHEYDRCTLSEIYKSVSDSNVSSVELVIYGFTEDAEQEFTKGFSDNVPFEYNLNKDVQSTCPWCAPWTWAAKCEYIDLSCSSIYQMGAQWAKKCSNEMMNFFAEDDEIEY